MIVSRRGLLAGIAAVLLAAGCTNSTSGTAQSVPAPPRKVAPEAIEFRMVLTDGTGETTLSDKDGMQYHLGPVLMNGTQVASAAAQYQQNYPAWVVVVRLTSEGGRVFAQVTTDNVGEQVAIVIDDQVVSAPRIQSAIVDGTVLISGNYTQTTAKALADRINGR